MTLPPENSDCTSDYSQWYHCSTNKGIPDDILSEAWNQAKNISFVFHHRSAKTEAEPKPTQVKKKSKEKKVYIDDDGDYTDPESNNGSDDDYKND